MQALVLDCEGNQAQKAGLENKLVYICGPLPFIQDMEGTIRSFGITRIFYENWWTGNAKQTKDTDQIRNNYPQLGQGCEMGDYHVNK